MRIALFSEVYWPMVSGVSLSLRRLVDALHARGHVTRVYSSTYELPAGQADRPEVHRSPSRPLFVAPEVQWAFPRQAEITADLAAFAPDIVHVLTEAPMGLAGVRAARALDLPIVASAHTDYEKYTAEYGLTWLIPAAWTYMRWFYRHAAVVLAPSTQYEQHLRLRGIRHTGIWSRGVHSDVFHPRFRSEAWRAQVGAGPDDVVVTYIGRLAPEKKLGVLLEAWRRLGERRRGARLVFTGSGLMEETLRTSGLEGLHLTPPLHGEALSTAYASADVFAFPSTTETFGNVLLEAMSSQVACVTAAAGGVLDFARDGVNALLAEPEDPAHLAEQLARLIAEAPLRRALAAGARRTAEGRSWDAIFDGLIATYGAVAIREAVARAA